MRRYLIVLAALLLVFPLNAFEFSNNEKTVFFNVGYDTNKTEYQETGESDKKDEGTFHGGFMRFKTYKPFGDLTSSTDTFFSLEGRFLMSNDVDREATVPTYTGLKVVDLYNCPGGACPVIETIPSYTPDSNKTREQYMWEITALGGQRFINQKNFALEGYLGFGFRRYTDKAGDSQRTSGKTNLTNLYAPLGVGLETKAAGFRVKINAEGAWYFINTISDSAEWVINKNAGSYYMTNPDNNDNTASGWGWKISADIEKDFGIIGVTFSPYYRFFKLNKFGFQEFYTYQDDGTHYYTDSLTGEPLGRTYPGSETKEYGFQLSVLF